MSETLLQNDFLENIEENKHIIYQLGDELYGSKLISIREILKVKDIKSVPFMNDYFLGIFNLRGHIISVIDLRMKFGIEAKNYKDGLVMVFQTDEGKIGAVVDDVISVVNFEETFLEKNIPIKTKIPKDFFTGVGKFKERLVNIVDIGKTLSSDDFAIINRKKGEIS